MRKARCFAALQETQDCTHWCGATSDGKTSNVLLRRLPLAPAQPATCPAEQCNDTAPGQKPAGCRACISQ